MLLIRHIIYMSSCSLHSVSLTLIKRSQFSNHKILVHVSTIFRAYSDGAYLFIEPLNPSLQVLKLIGP